MNVLVTTQADGSQKHWHATSGKCLHARKDEPNNHLYTLDFTPDGTILAVDAQVLAPAPPGARPFGATIALPPAYTLA